LEEFEAHAGKVFDDTLDRPSWDMESNSLEPLCTVCAKDEEVVIQADLPYASPETLEVKFLDDNSVQIKAMMKRSLRFSDLGLVHRRGEFVRFKREVRLPAPVETESAKVSFKGGILEVHFPRKKES